MFLSAFLPIMSLWLGEVWNKRVFTVQSERLSLSAQLRIYESVEDQTELIDAQESFSFFVFMIKHDLFSVRGRKWGQRSIPTPYKMVMLHKVSKTLSLSLSLSLCLSHRVHLY